MTLKNKIIVITGAASGIGKSLAVRLRDQGAIVVASDRASEALEIFTTETGVHSVVADVRVESEIQNLAKTVFEKFGRIDMWINNAGVFYNFSNDDEFIDMEKAHQIVDTNFFGSIYGTRAALKYMKAQNEGNIVQILSTAALDATRAKNAKIYAGSKWAIRGYMQGVVAENESTGITFYSIYPGGTRTSLYDAGRPDNYDEYMDPEYLTQKIVDNFLIEVPERELIIKRPTA